MSTLKVNTIQNTDNTHPSTPKQLVYGRVKVWWNYAQRTGPAISKSYNVTSITDNATGQYTVNFSVTLHKPCGASDASYNTDAFDPGRETAARVFSEYWANASYGTETVPGIFSQQKPTRNIALSRFFGSANAITAYVSRANGTRI